jgi:hypothetical protein
MRTLHLADVILAVDPVVHGPILALAERPEVEEIVVLENMQLTSPQRGALKIVPIGPTLAYTSRAAFRGRLIGEHPDEMMNPVAVVPVKALRTDTPITPMVVDDPAPVLHPRATDPAWRSWLLEFQQP